MNIRFFKFIAGGALMVDDHSISFGNLFVCLDQKYRTVSNTDIAIL